MDGLTFVSKLFEFTAWPIATVVLCVVLRKPLQELLDRLTSAKHKDTELGFAPKTQNAPKIENNVAIADAVPQDALGLIKEAEDKIYESLDNLGIKSNEDKVKVLAKHHANLQIRSAYSQINSNIYESQLNLLQALNLQPEPVELSFFKSYYDNAKEKYSEQYKTYSFDSWLNYMKNAGLLNVSDGKYFITVLGRGFLTALTESGINQARMY
jgi:hypothetical protein